MDANSVAQRLLNFESTLDVQLLDEVVGSLYAGKNVEQAQAILNQFKEHPDAYARVDVILERSARQETKFFGLQVLEHAIRYRWKALPDEQRAGIKDYIVNMIIQLSSDFQQSISQKTFLSKLNLLFVQILKQEWPHNWSSFIPEFVESARSNESLCRNNLNILALMSEEIFDFSEGEMTKAKIQELKQSFYKEFSLIYQLCEFVMNNASQPALIEACLHCLLKFLSWIPLQYFVERKHRCLSLKCLTEIASMNIGGMYDEKFQQLYVSVVQTLQAQNVPADQGLGELYEEDEEDWQTFIETLGCFFSSYFRHHIKGIENEHPAECMQGHWYMVAISRVDDTEVFKTCNEYWNYLASDLFRSEMGPAQRSLRRGGGMTSEAGQPPLWSAHARPTLNTPRCDFYGQLLTAVRLVLISKMAKPEEVLITEDENGDLIREFMKDVDTIQLYNAMKETLLYLTNLDEDDTMSIMLEKLAAQLDGVEWSWHTLNTLCWAIGAISGAMQEDTEKRFLIDVIKRLLELCELKKGKENKAVIASNIMYVVGQYPRFLRAHWKFLRTVVMKLFEFMRETFPGVQDMACDTFLKISMSCRTKFVEHHRSNDGSVEAPFVYHIIEKLHNYTELLNSQQINTFYEAVGFMLAASKDESMRKDAILKFMNSIHSVWTRILAEASQNVTVLKSSDTTKNLTDFLKCNTHCAKSMGSAYAIYLSQVFHDLLNIFKAYSEFISTEVQERGPEVVRHVNVRHWRGIKKNILAILGTFFENAGDRSNAITAFLQPLLDVLLTDFQTTPAPARDAEAIQIMGTIVEQFRSEISSTVPGILVCALDGTLELITQNFHEYPEHRQAFFRLLQAVMEHIFQAIFQIPSDKLGLLVDSVIWAVKHDERNVAEMGLVTLEKLLVQIQHDRGLESQFYQRYFASLLEDMFFVLTDGLHKPGFKYQAKILRHVFQVGCSDKLPVPLWESTNDFKSLQFSSNAEFVSMYTKRLLAGAFQNLSETQVSQVVIQLTRLDLSETDFKSLLRDFLVQSKEWSSADLAEDEDGVNGAASSATCSGTTT